MACETLVFLVSGPPARPSSRWRLSGRWRPRRRSCTSSKRPWASVTSRRPAVTAPPRRERARASAAHRPSSHAGELRPGEGELEPRRVRQRRAAQHLRGLLAAPGLLGAVVSMMQAPLPLSQRRRWQGGEEDRRGRARASAAHRSQQPRGRAPPRRGRARASALGACGSARPRSTCGGSWPRGCRGCRRRCRCRKEEDGTVEKKSRGKGLALPPFVERGGGDGDGEEETAAGSKAGSGAGEVKENAGGRSDISRGARHVRILLSPMKKKIDIPLLAASMAPSPLGHSHSLLHPSVLGPPVTEPISIATRRTTARASISPWALGFLMGDGSRQEPAVSRLSDGLPQKPALGFNSFLQIPDKIQNSLKVHFGRFLKKDGAGRGMNAEMSPEMGKESCTAAAQVSLDRQLQAWRNNPSWTDEPPEIKVTVPEGSLCNLNLRFKAGLPPDAVYNIIIDPENKRVFKNIKEVISRKVLLDEGSRQVVEVEQAAIWKFLWWSGILAVHVFVEQNRKNHTVKFKQGRTGFMRKFGGCWRIEPIFVDKEVCLPLHPCTLEEYESCTGGRGRVASAITLDQLIEPALLPPPPISWYLRGITSRTTEMLVNDLIAETARLRGISNNADGKQDVEEICDASKSHPVIECGDIKERWRQRRKSGRHGNSLRLTSQFL